MAYFQSYNPDDDEKDKAGQAQPQVQPSAVAVPDSAPSAAPNTSGPASTAQQPTAQNPGKYVSFVDRYMANKDSADRTAQRLQNDVSTRGQNVQTGINGAFNTFTQKAQDGTANPLGTGRTQIQPGVNTLGKPQVGRPTVATPLPQQNRPGTIQGVTHSPDKTWDQLSDDDLKKVASTSYTGPADLQASMGNDAYAKLIADAQDASQRAGLVGSADGRQTLMKNQGGPGNGFDEALANAGGTDWSALKARFGGLSDQLGEKADAAKGTADYNRDLTQKYADNAKGLLDDRKTIADNEAANPDAGEFHGDTRGHPIDTHDHGVNGEPKSGVYYNDIPDGTTGNANFRDYIVTLYGTGILAGHSRAIGQQVWNSMTPEEVADWNAMPAGLRYDFIQQRAKELGIEV